MTLRANGANLDGALDHEVPCDDALPQLAVVLNECVMKDVFQRNLFGPGDTPARLVIENCEITRVRYKPGKICTICYRLSIHDPRTHHEVEQTVSARVYASGASAAEWSKAQSQEVVTPSIGIAMSYIPELDLIIWVFPNDRKLKALPKLTSAICLKNELLPEIISAKYSPACTISDLAIDIVNYVPGYSCTVRVRLELQNRDTNEIRSLVVYGKTYAEGQGVASFLEMQKLAAFNARERGQLRLAELLNYDREHQIFWQIGLPGRTLFEHDMTQPNFPVLLESMASALSELHAIPLAYAKKLEVHDLTVELQGARVLLSRSRPSLRKDLDGVIDRLQVQAQSLGAQPVATLHGDLHLKNFIVEEGAVTLIDLEDLCRGSPLQDIGSCIAFLLYRGLVLELAPWLVEKMIVVFVERYQKQTSWPVPANTLNWYVATALINERAVRCLTRLKGGGLDMVDQLVRLASKVAGDNNTSHAWIGSAEWSAIL